MSFLCLFKHKDVLAYQDDLEMPDGSSLSGHSHVVTKHFKCLRCYREKTKHKKYHQRRQCPKCEKETRFYLWVGSDTMFDEWQGQGDGIQNYRCIECGFHTHSKSMMSDENWRNWVLKGAQ